MMEESPQMQLLNNDGREYGRRKLPGKAMYDFLEAKLPLAGTTKDLHL